jgi:hypothetical protein
MTDYILQSKSYKHFTLLNLETGEENGSFQDAKAAARILPGDIVHLDESGLHLKIRGEHPPLVGFLMTRSKTIYGMTSRNVPIFLFHPFDRSYPPMRVAMKNADRTKNYIIYASFDSWEKGDTFPRGSYEGMVGFAGTDLVDKKAMEIAASPYYKSVYRVEFEEPVAPEGEERIMIAQPSWQTINIDPEGCLDIDDTFSWRHSAIDGHYDIAIGIADVDATIPSGSAYDKVARKNATTIYTPEGRAVRPMFPKDLSEGRLSLHPQANAKPTLSLLFSFSTTTKEIDNIHFALTQTQNNKTYTYEEAQSCEAAPLLTALTQTIQTECPALASEDAKDSHIWIQALMVFYNLRAAKLLKATGSGILRAHKAPDQEKLAEYTTINPALAIFAMEAAIYTHPTNPCNHFGFNADYCHATSPIRRYADLFNQRALKALLAGHPALPSPDGQLIYHLNKRQKAAKSYTREMVFANLLHNSIVNMKRVNATIIRKTPELLTLYVSDWKQIIKVRMKTDYIFALGETVEMCYTYDTSQLFWKDRLLFCLEPLIQP